MQCEMCGKATPRARKFLIEGTILQVCTTCERFGQPLDAGPGKPMPVAPGNVGMAMEKRRRQMGSRDLYASQSMGLELVHDFAARIKTAREGKGLSRQQLGAAVGEREVVIGRYEQGSLHPPDDVAKKIERELGIRLFEPAQTGTTQRSAPRSMTLGDMLRDAMRKKDE